MSQELEEIKTYVNKCYMEILKRQADEGGLTTYADLILQKVIKPEKLPVLLRSSIEWRQRFGPEPKPFIISAPRGKAPEFRFDIMKLVRFGKVGILVNWGQRCGVAEHTKYFVDQLSSKYTVQSAGSFDDLFRMFKELRVLHIEHEFSLFNLDVLKGLIAKAKELGVKVILDMHSVNSSFFNMAEQLVDKIIVHNPQVVSGEKTEVIPLATPVSQKLDKSKLREKYKIKGSPVIATFGFIVNHKGLQEIVRAISLLKQSYFEIRYLIVGSLHPRAPARDYLRRLRNEIKRLDLEANVSLFSDFYPIEVAIEILGCSDLTCLFYHKVGVQSGSGPARICLAAHRPLIVSDIPMFAEFGEAVERLPEGNVDVLASSINSLLGDSTRQQVLVEKGDKYLEQVSGVTVARKFEKIYRELGG